MFRKIAIAFAAFAAIGAASLAAPATASAGWHGHHHGHHWGHGYRFGFYGPSYVAYDGCHMKKRWVQTPFGARLRWVKVCY